MTHRRLALGLALAAALSFTAQAQEPVLKGSQVTESALIDALSVDTPAAEGTGRTRGFRPAHSATGSGAAPASAKPAKAGPGKASLLITFATDSSELTPSARQSLDTVAKALQSDQLAGLTFRVEGHADPRGGADRNLKLSQARAESVVSYLVSQHGVLPERLVAQGKGSSELMDRSRPDAPENRRVTLVTQRP